MGSVASIAAPIAGGLISNKGAQNAAQTAANAQQQISQQAFQQAVAYQQQQQQALQGAIGQAQGGMNSFFGAPAYMPVPYSQPGQDLAQFGGQVAANGMPAVQGALNGQSAGNKGAGAPQGGSGGSPLAPYQAPAPQASQAPTKAPAVAAQPKPTAPTYPIIPGQPVPYGPDAAGQMQKFSGSGMGGSTPTVDIPFVTGMMGQ